MLFGTDGINVDGLWVLATLAGAGGVIAFLFRLLIASKDREFNLLLGQKDRELAESESRKRSYSEMTSEAIASATQTTNYYRAKEGKPPLIVVAPVVSEGHSPSTKEQREAAEIATMRAQIARIKLVTGQEPRPEPEHAVEIPKVEGVAVKIPEGTFQATVSKEPKEKPNSPTP